MPYGINESDTGAETSRAAMMYKDKEKDSQKSNKSSLKKIIIQNIKLLLNPELRKRFKDMEFRRNNKIFDIVHDFKDKIKESSKFLPELTTIVDDRDTVNRFYKVSDEIICQISSNVPDGEWMTLTIEFTENEKFADVFTYKTQDNYIKKRSAQNYNEVKIKGLKEITKYINGLEGKYLIKHDENPA